jgi:hypothetical protein
MYAGYNSVYEGRQVTGFRGELVDDQGSDVYRHIQFSAGAVLTGAGGMPVGLLGFGALTANDAAQWFQGKRGAPAELRDDIAGLQVGSALFEAVFRKNYKEVRTKVTKILCQ